MKLKNIGIAAFVFTTREKDRGGIHLCISNSAVNALLTLLDEIAATQKDYSRHISLIKVTDELPRRIFVGSSYRSLNSLHISFSIHSDTQISVEKKEGRIALSSNGLHELRKAINLVTQGLEDFCIMGSSGAWTDRLWFWSLDQ